jgi:hypothetical protein
MLLHAREVMVPYVEGGVPVTAVAPLPERWPE